MRTPCRAAATCAAYLGLESHLILRTSEGMEQQDPGLAGNLLPERMQGAHLHQVCCSERYSEEHSSFYFTPNFWSQCSAVCSLCNCRPSSTGRLYLRRLAFDCRGCLIVGAASAIAHVWHAGFTGRLRSAWRGGTHRTAGAGAGCRWHEAVCGTGGRQQQPRMLGLHHGHAGTPRALYVAVLSGHVFLWPQLIRCKLALCRSSPNTL